MNKIVKFVDNNKTTILVFTIIFILLAFQHSVIGMYFDDYGNASLSYSYIVDGVKGTNYNISQLLEWAIHIYNGWGGRILYAIVFIIPLLKHGITAYMAAQTFILLGIFYLMYKLSEDYLEDKGKRYLIPIILFILYSCIDMAYLRHGIYWASASVLYIWPLFPLFLSIYLYNKLCKKIKKNEKINYWLYFPILFLSIIFTTMSQEQYGITLIAYIVSYIVLTHIKNIKEYIKLDLFSLIVAISSYLVLFMAPGNWARMATNVEFSKLSFFGKILRNTPRIFYALFFDKQQIYVYLLCGIMLYIIYEFLKERKINKYFLYFSGLVSVIQIIIVKFNIQHIASYLFFAIWFLDIATLTFIYLYKEKKLGLMAMEIAAICSEFCLLVSPTVGGRTCLPYMFMLFVIITCFIIFMININEKTYNTFIIIIFLIIGLYGAKNYYVVYSGYRNNYPIYKLNDRIYKEYESGDTLTLYKPINSWFGSTQSYEEPSMDIWIKEYYDIPQEVQFNWVAIYGDVNE